MNQLLTSIKTLKAKNENMKSHLSQYTLWIYFLNRRKNVLKKIRDHLQSLKILKESIPIIWNLIENGNNFDTAMKLMDSAFTYINQKLSALTVTQQLRKRITDAEFKSKKKIEEDLQQLLDYSFSTLILFTPCIENEGFKTEMYKFLANMFNEEKVLKRMKLDYIYSGWTF